MPRPRPDEHAETVGEALRRGGEFLGRRGVAEATRNARFLLAHALGIDLSGLLGRHREPLTEAARQGYDRLLRARGQRRPLQHLLGRWEFFGIELVVDQRALIPRPDTETLVEVVLRHLSRQTRRIADIGTGSGCIAIALALQLPECQILATDIWRPALELAAENLARHGLGERVRLLSGDLLGALDGCVAPATLDAVVSNPPYVGDAEIGELPAEVRDHDPPVALAGGPTGLELFTRLVDQAGAWLRRGGLLACEIGAGQADRALSRVSEAGYQEIRLWPDLAGIPRVITAWWR